MGEFLSFRKMITPTIIQIVFWILLVVVVLAALASIVSGLGNRYGGGTQVLGGLIMLVLGPLVVRIYCELLILFFRINDTLTDIKDTLQRRP